MLITKIKFEDTSKTIIVYEQLLNNGAVTKETSYKCDDERHPDFQTAVNDLIPLCISMLKLPEKYTDGITVRGISLSENEHQGMGAVITLLKAISGINSPLVINTPHVHNAEEGDSIMPSVLRIQIESVLKHAEAFVDGKRAQGNLFDNNLKVTVLAEQKNK